MVIYCAFTVLPLHCGSLWVSTLHLNQNAYNSATNFYILQLPLDSHPILEYRTFPVDVLISYSNYQCSEHPTHLERLLKNPFPCRWLLLSVCLNIKGPNSSSKCVKAFVIKMNHEVATHFISNFDQSVGSSIELQFKTMTPYFNALLAWNGGKMLMPKPLQTSYDTKLAKPCQVGYR